MNLRKQAALSTTFPAMSALSSSSCSWMPLEGAAQLWATFAGTFLTYPAFTVTSAVFSALSLETRALRQYEHACYSCLNGDDLHARAACEQAVHDLQDASSQWMSTLSWLERLASDSGIRSVRMSVLLFAASSPRQLGTSSGSEC